jgi:bifunctional ADP-heptose synthase (sugar kinase/adenylyltransferase)
VARRHVDGRLQANGTARPFLGEALRAEMLANLHMSTGLRSTDPDAVSAINLLHPGVYVKGKDYQNPEGDVTGKIVAERKAVESHGGRIHFTDEVVFSSTELINRHLNVFEPHLREHLKTMRDDGGLAKMLELIDRIRDYRVLVVGDAIIDEYQYVLPMGKPPKESVIATRFQDRELFAGGVVAAANHVASFCKQVDVITAWGPLTTTKNSSAAAYGRT